MHKWEIEERNRSSSSNSVKRCEASCTKFVVIFACTMAHICVSEFHYNHYRRISSCHLSFYWSLFDSGVRASDCSPLAEVSSNPLLQMDHFAHKSMGACKPATPTRRYFCTEGFGTSTLHPLLRPVMICHQAAEVQGRRNFGLMSHTRPLHGM